MRKDMARQEAIKEGVSDFLAESAQRSRSLEEEYQEMDNQQYEEWKQFEAAGWVSLDCSRPFYLEKTNLPDGTTETVASTKTQPNSPSIEWFCIQGDVMPPENCWSTRSVMVVKDGVWETAKSENTFTDSFPNGY